MAREACATALLAHPAIVMRMRGTRLTALIMLFCLACLPLSMSSSHTTEFGFVNYPGGVSRAFSNFGHGAGRGGLGMKVSSPRSKISARSAVKMAVKLPSEQALRTLIGVLGKHSNDGVIQAKGCEALLELSSRSEVTRMAIFEVGGVDAAFAAIATHPDNDDVQRAAALLLRGEEPTASPPAPAKATSEKNSRDVVSLAPTPPTKQEQVVEKVTLEPEVQPVQEQEQDEVQKPAVELAQTESKGKSKVAETEANADEGAEEEVFQGRLSPFAKDIDPDLDPEAFRDALRDNIYAFQKKSLGNQAQENYMDYLKAPTSEEEDAGAAAKKPASKLTYDLYARSPRAAALEETESSKKSGTVTLRKPIASSKANKKNKKSDATEPAIASSSERVETVEPAAEVQADLPLPVAPSISLSNDALLELQLEEEEKEKEEEMAQREQKRTAAVSAVEQPPAPAPAPSPSLQLSPDVLLQLQEEEQEEEEAKPVSAAKRTSGSALTEARGESEEVKEEEEVFQGRLSPFAKDIDPDLDPEAFRDALRDNIYAFQKKSLGNQAQENYMDYLKAPTSEEEDAGAAAKKPASKLTYDLYARSPRAAALEETESSKKSGTVTLRKPIASSKASKKKSKKADKQSKKADKKSKKNDAGRF